MKYNHKETLDDLSKTGVYTITNTVNGKLYVGSTSMSFNYRWRKHYNKLLKNQHENYKLQNAWNKYGESNFIFEILENTDKNLAVFTEQYWINILSPIINGYNISPTAFSPKGYKHTKETKNKMSKSKIGNTLRLDIPHEEKIKLQIKESVLNFYKDDNENVRQLKNNKKDYIVNLNKVFNSVNNKIKIVQFDIDGLIQIKIWDSAKDVEKELGFKATNITQCCKGNYKTCKNYIWKYYVE